MYYKSENVVQKIMYYKVLKMYYKTLNLYYKSENVVQK